MRAMVVAPFRATRPDRTGDRAILPMPFSTGHPLGWLLEVDEGTVGVVGRPARASGKAKSYRIPSALRFRSRKGGTW